MPLFTVLLRLPRVAKALILVSVDATLGGAAFWLAALARSGQVPVLSASYFVAATGFAMVLVPLAGFVCGLYKAVIRFKSPQLSARAGLVSALTGASIATVGYLGGASYPKAIGLGTVFALVLFVFIVLSRHAARMLLGSVWRITSGAPIAVFGAGDAGRQLVEILRRGKDLTPVFFIDDDASLQGRTIEGLPVIGPRQREFADRLKSKGVKEILLAIPSASIDRRREILHFLGDLPFHVRSVPRLSELVNKDTPDQELVADLKEVSIEELLGREPISPLAGLLEKCVAGKVVLVTGGGGSIGSELCRQVLSLRPDRLIVLDHSEYSLYQLEREFTSDSASKAAGGVRAEFVLASVMDRPKIESLIKECGVNTIYHAAAYKHVPIVEQNPLAGIRNNVLGTWYVAQAAANAAVGHFVLISSDKAVRPTNVMGATKRMAELVVQMLAERQSGTVFSMVRFGNVLGSSGSVVPLFREQIERGGPVTVTHPEVTRYFMTIQEAVQLVIQAGAMAQGGEVFVLDMGAPVKIVDLASKMIRLSGRTIRDESNPNADISIELVGLRPGEKLYEELLISGEAAETMHPRIWQARENTVQAAALEAELHALRELSIGDFETVDVRRILSRWVDGYTPDARGEGQGREERSASAPQLGADRANVLN